MSVLVGWQFAHIVDGCLNSLGIVHHSLYWNIGNVGVRLAVSAERIVDIAVGVVFHLAVLQFDVGLLWCRLLGKSHSADAAKHK